MDTAGASWSVSLGICVTRNCPLLSAACSAPHLGLLKPQLPKLRLPAVVVVETQPSTCCCASAPSAAPREGGHCTPPFPPVILCRTVLVCALLAFNGSLNYERLHLSPVPVFLSRPACLGPRLPLEQRLEFEQLGPILGSPGFSKAPLQCSPT